MGSVGGSGGECEHAVRRWFFRLQKGVPVGVSLELRVFVVVQTRAAHVFVIHGKAERLNQVQGAAGVGRQADDVAGIGWNFGFDEDNMKHRLIVVGSGLGRLVWIRLD